MNKGNTRYYGCPFSPPDRKDTTKIICATRKKVAVVRVRVNVGVTTELFNCEIDCESDTDI